MKDLATKVLKECSGPKEPIGIGGGASVTEGYKSTDEKGHTGVWVFRAEEKDKGKPDVPSPNEPSVPFPEEEPAEEEPSTGEDTPSNGGGIGEGERVVTFE